MKREAILGLLVTYVVLGCFVPGPEHYRRIPELSGVVLQSGSPVAGAPIWATDDREPEACRDSPSEALRTARDGSFHLSAVERFRLGVVVTGGDPGVLWSLCINPLGGAPRHWLGFALGYEAPPGVQLRCDIDTADVCTVVSYVE